MGTQLGLKGGDVAAIPLHRSRTSVQYTDAGEADRNGCSSLDLDFGQAGRCGRRGKLGVRLSGDDGCHGRVSDP